MNMRSHKIPLKIVLAQHIHILIETNTQRETYFISFYSNASFSIQVVNLSQMRQRIGWHGARPSCISVHIMLNTLLALMKRGVRPRTSGTAGGGRTDRLCSSHTGPPTSRRREQPVNKCHSALGDSINWLRQKPAPGYQSMRIHWLGEYQKVDKGQTTYELQSTLIYRPFSAHT